MLCLIVSILAAWALPNDLKDTDYTQHMIGVLDKSLHVKISFTTSGSEATGTIRYGESDDTFVIEGGIENGLLTLYEFDSNSRVSAIIEGKYCENQCLWTWSNSNYSTSLPLHVQKDTTSLPQIYLLKSEKGAEASTVFLRDLTNQISIDKDNKISLRWMDYECKEELCFEKRPDIKLNNPIEFSYLKDKHPRDFVIHPNREYKTRKSITIKNISLSDFENLASFNYPDLDVNFSAWAENIIKEQLRPIHTTISKRQEYKSSNLRFGTRTYGDFYLTHFSGNLVSGFLYFYSTTTNETKTVAFIYDLQKKRHYDLDDLFKSDFDYPFFLNQYISKRKRAILLRDSGLVQRFLKEQKFNHAVVVPEGLLFMTDFHVLFGRRHILVPIHEIRTFMKNKAVIGSMARA